MNTLFTKTWMGAFLLIFCFMTMDVSARSGSRRHTRGHNAYFIFTDNHPFFSEPLLIKTSRKSTKLQLSKRNVSRGVRIPKDGKFSFYSKEANTFYADKPFLQISIPKSLKKVLVVLSPPQSPTDKSFSFKVIDIAHFEPGGWLFINQTDSETLVKMGEKEIKILPGKFEICKVKTLKKRGAKHVIDLSYYYLKDGKRSLLSSSQCVVSPVRREICIFSYSKTKRITYHGVSFSEE